MYRLLGRDPQQQPLTQLELELLERCLFDAVSAEFTPRTETALLTGSPNLPGD